jgi:uncharacterized protein (TIGR01627 family)
MTKLKRLIMALSVRVCVLHASAFLLGVIRWAADIQLSVDELGLAITAIAQKRPCRLLVFGLGNDTPLWMRVNRGGTTVFIEDDEAWFRRVLARHRRAKAHLVSYRTQRAEWRGLLASTERLSMTLPDEVERARWDVILVDAPAGYEDSSPGRMMSIALARRLASDGADIFVHDCDRLVEQEYCDRLLKPENLQAEVGIIRHYRLQAQPAAR